MLATADGVKP